MSMMDTELGGYTRTTIRLSGMTLGFDKNSGKFYVAIDSNPNNTVGSSYLR